jgi:choline-glycine betaine transporter
MAIRYAFYPLIGTRACGITGDLIDIFSIITTIMGVCTSLGLGAMQLNDGFQRMSFGFFRGTLYNVPANTTLYSAPWCGGQGERCEQEQIPYGIQTNVETQLIIVACVTCLATASVVSGLNTGIVNLSRVTFAIGMFLLLCVLFLGEPYHALNVTTQAMGYYIWYLPKIGFQTDAYEALGDSNLGLGGASDAGGGPTWMAGWTLFYWGWWISWAPFVGTFIARISKGRTMRQFIIGTTIVPSMYSFVWMGVFGSEGIRMQRIADSTGLCKVAKMHDPSLCQQEGNLRAANCYLYAASYTREMKEKLGIGFDPNCQLDPVYHDGFGRCKEFKWERRVEVGNECVMTTSWVHMPCNKEPQSQGGPGRCMNGACDEDTQMVPDPTALAYPPVRGPCKGIIMMSEVDPASSKRTFNWFYGAQPKCFVPVPDNIVCLDGHHSAGPIFFDQLSSYGPKGFSDFLCTFATICLILYFVTSSDSGSYVVDMFASNGDEDPPTSQRIFWSITEGATCSALLWSGKNLPTAGGSLKALQGASLLTGLPYTFIMFYVSQALVLLCKEECGEYSKKRKDFKKFIVDFSYPTKIIANTIAPGVSMGRIIGHVGGWPFYEQSPHCSAMVFTFIFQGMYCMAIGLVCITGILEHWHIMSLILYLGFGTFLCFLRNNVRTYCEIPRGELVTDLICGIFAPMFTLTQMELELFSPKVIEEDDGYDAETQKMLTTYGLPRD